MQYPLDLIGIFAFAVSGAVLAVRKDFDIFGTVLMAAVSGLGGGLFRDLVLNIRPVAFTDLGFWLTPVVAAVVVFFWAGVQRAESCCEVSDAAALGLFSVTGTVKALAHGFGPAPAATLGVGTAVGGGILCGVIAREVPVSLRWDRDLYVLPSLIGAATVAVLHGTGRLNVATAAGAALLAFGVRLLAVHFGWRTVRSPARLRAQSPSRRRPRRAERPDTPRRIPDQDTVELAVPPGFARWSATTDEPWADASRSHVASPKVGAGSTVRR
ncbi:trimeric intracellular cation channel family protein [Streptomyces zaomyceticus]|uniref:trimeric intracellular cation channel family protein n=1 Tax=Streptomyces zaomyceticus TaxID=68286 RepID=UPI00369746F0